MVRTKKNLNFSKRKRLRVLPNHLGSPRSRFQGPPTRQLPAGTVSPPARTRPPPHAASAEGALLQELRVPPGSAPDPPLPKHPVHRPHGALSALPSTPTALPNTVTLGPLNCPHSHVSGPLTFLRPWVGKCHQNSAGQARWEEAPNAGYSRSQAGRQVVRGQLLTGLRGKDTTARLQSPCPGALYLLKWPQHSVCCGMLGWAGGSGGSQSEGTRPARGCGTEGGLPEPKRGGRGVLWAGMTRKDHHNPPRPDSGGWVGGRA